MAALLDVFGFLAVLLRGISLALECLLIGGSVFSAFAKPGVLLRGAALAMVLVQAVWLGVNSALLQSTTGIPWSAVWSAEFFVAGLLTIVGALLILFGTTRAIAPQRALFALGSALALAGSVLTSHSAARLDHRVLLMLFTGGHQLGAALWLGGLPFFLQAQSQSAEGDEASRAQLGTAFTRQALTGVSLLLVSGLTLAVVYIRYPHLVYGTSYGVMTAAKTTLLILLLALGWQNNRLLADKLLAGVSRLRLHRFTEAEIGIGVTTILAAASLTSQPPAIDTQSTSVPAGVIAARFTPHVPLMRTPALAELSPVTPLSPEEALAFHRSTLDTYVPGVPPSKTDSAADIAWSEYNHNWAGLIVFAAGVGAVLSRFRWGRWARHWPLAFLGLAAFLLLRADSENWPLGPRGFWESFAVAEVAQHRVFVLLIVLFAVFEWGVQTGRIRSRRAALVFPAVCAAGSTLLLAHNHSLVNVQEQLLAELSHTPIALLGLLAAWTRWLEIRLPNPPPRWAVNTWPFCFVAIGYLLLIYREH